MGNSTRKKDKEDPTPAVVEGAAFPKRPRPSHPGLGAKGSVRSQEATGTRYTASEIAAASPLFPGGAEAFAHWVVESKRATALDRLTREEWQPHLEAFASRPIHGHRRAHGDNHRMNRHQIRRR